MLELANPVLAIITLVVSVVVFFVVWFVLEKRRKKPATSAETVLVANSLRIRESPHYRQALSKVWVIILTVAVSVLLLSLLSVIGAGRLVNVSVEKPERYNRDIMLCLDVSGSMEVPNTQIIDTFLGLANDFKGERIGLTLFNSTPATVFPLTDDYEYVKANLEKVKRVLNSPYMEEDNRDAYTIFASTMGGQNGSSLAGDGLYGCVLGFDFIEHDEERSRSIIMASDNVIAGTELVTITDAAEAARQHGVFVYGITPSNDSHTGFFIPPSATEEFEEAVTHSGGFLSTLSNSFTAKRIVEKISATEATRMQGSPIYLKTDISQTIIPIIGGGYLLYVFLTRRYRV